jgi:hypothetical protein
MPWNVVGELTANEVQVRGFHLNQGGTAQFLPCVPEVETDRFPLCGRGVFVCLDE